MGKVPASQASLTLSLITVWGLMFGAVFNHDRLTPLAWAGASVIMAATIVPKVFDVLSDRKTQTSKEDDADALEPNPPITLTSEEFVRTTVSATMLAATPSMSDAGLLASRAVAKKAMETAISSDGAPLLGMAAESMASAGAGVAEMAARVLPSAEAGATVTASAAEAIGVGAAEASAAAAAGAAAKAATAGVLSAAAGSATAAGASTVAASAVSTAGLAVAGGAAAAAASAVVTGAVSTSSVSTALNSATGAIMSGVDTLNAAGTGSIVGATEAVISGVRSVGDALTDPTVVDPHIAAAQAAAESAAETVSSTPLPDADDIKKIASPVIEAIKMLLGLR